MLSNHGTSCIHVQVCFCLCRRLPVPKELVVRGHSWVIDTLLCPPLLSSSCCFKSKLLLKGKNGALLATSAQHQYGFLRPHRKKWNHCFARACVFSPVTVAGRWPSSLTAHEDYSTMCPAGNTARWVCSVELGIRGVRFENRPCLVTLDEGSTVTSKAIGVLCWDFTSSVVKKKYSLLQLTLFNLKD